MEIGIPEQLATLGHPQRLEVFRLLMRRYPDRVPAGELAAALSVKPSTLSSYLAALQRAGLVRPERAGTSLLYGVRMEAVQGLLGGLLNGCCGGRIELCLPGGATPPPVALPARRHRVLFVCNGNSTRSILAEAILRAQAGERFEALSAGLHPRAEIHPQVRALLRDKGHDLAGLRPKGLAEITAGGGAPPDFVFTVCNRAANERCPTWPGHPLSGHWGMGDPAAVPGGPAEKALALQEAYGLLSRRIAAFAALPLASLDRLALQGAVDDIGRPSPAPASAPASAPG